MRVLASPTSAAPKYTARAIERRIFEGHVTWMQVYTQGAPMTCVGTPQWMAPEILRGER
jgi:hypothetical protein